MKKYFLIVLLTVSEIVAFGQTPDLWDNPICGYQPDTIAEGWRASDCSNSAATYLNYYRNPGFWTPDVHNNTPIKTIRLNFVVFQKDDGTGTGTCLDNAATNIEFNKLVDSLNYRYSHIPVKGYASTCQPPITYIVDSKIRFQLNDVLFFQNSDIYNGVETNTNALLYVHNQAPSSVNCMNIMLVQKFNGPVENTNAAGFYTSPISGHHSITSRKMWSNISGTQKVGHFAHELGHALGLDHSYDGNEPLDINDFDFLDDVFGTCPEPLMTDPNNPCFDSCGVGTYPCVCIPAPGYVCFLKSSCFLNNFPSGHPFMSGNGEKSKYLSPKQAGRLHRSLSLIESYFVVYNKHMHKYVIEEYPDALPYNITANETWDFTIKMYQNIVVKPGAVLTIKCTVLMPREGKIIVEPGGKLIVDGGTITCAHDSFWWGIEAHGNSSISQFTNQQPEILIKNEAVIEHARYGVSLWKPGYFLTTGGFVRAYNSTFRNNINDAYIMQYSNDHNGNHYANKTFFSNVEFYWDDNFRTTNPIPHVMMAQVDGIIFTGCTFNDLRNPSTYSMYCMGIFSLDAKYKVTARCTTLGCSGAIDDPGSNWDPTLFENLYFGIYATNSSTANTVNIDRCLFRDNGYGIELIGVLSPVIVRNRFEFTNNPNHFAVTSAMHGIHAVSSKMLTVEENKFIDLAPGTHGAGSYAMVCSDLGDQDERIYKNIFQSMTYGCFSQGKNRSATTTPKGLTGLEFLCNTNFTNHWDHRVRDDLWGIDGPNYGVKKTSGTFFKPIGVTYSNDIGNIYHDEDYSNSSNFPITIWNNTSQFPDDYSTSVTMLATPNVNPCASTLTDYPGGLHGLTPAHKASFKSGFSSAATNIANKEITYNHNLINATENNTIMQACAALNLNNKQAFKNLLYQHTPYITTDILFAVAAHPPTNFPHEWLRDLLLANIEAVTTDLYSYLSTKPYPMPQAYRQVVANAMGTTYTSRTTLESEISQLYSDQSFYANRLIIDKVQDTISIDTDTLRYWLKEHKSYLYQQQIIDAYLHDKNWTQATNEVNLLNAAKPNFPVEIQPEIESFVNFKNWLIPILQTPGLISQLPQNDLTILRDMAQNGRGKARYQAQNILCFFYNECSLYPIPSDLGTREMEQNTKESIPNETSKTSFTVRPNPATQWMAVSLVDPMRINEEKIVMVITDLSGKTVYETTLLTNTYTIDLRNFNAGVYLVTIKSEERFIGTEKVVIQK